MPSQAYHSKKTRNGITRALNLGKEKINTIGNTILQLDPPTYFSQFLSLSIYLIVTLIPILLLEVSFLASARTGDPEKVSAYECGFDPFDDSRSRFDIKFYLAIILFVIFDLEVVFLSFYSLVLKKVNFIGFLSMIVFLLVVNIGFLEKNGLKQETAKE